MFEKREGVHRSRVLGRGVIREPSQATHLLDYAQRASSVLRHTDPTSVLTGVEDTPTLHWTRNGHSLPTTISFTSRPEEIPLYPPLPRVVLSRHVLGRSGRSIPGPLRTPSVPLRPLSRTRSY